MSQDAPPTAANQAGAGVTARGLRRKRCIYTLLLGVTLGALVGLLNVSAANNQWSLQHDFFDIVDAPVKPLVINPALVQNGLRIRSHTNPHQFPIELVILCYWAIIGLLLTSLFCLVRTGVIRDIVRDKICGYLLFLGTCGGILIGSLSFLAASNGWDVSSNFFDSLNRPVYEVVNVLQERYYIMGSLSPDLRRQFIFQNTAAVIYWILICVFLSFVYCVIRILIKRKFAGGNSVAEE